MLVDPLTLTSSRLPVGDAEPKILTADDPFTTLTAVVPDEADPKIPMLEDPLTVALRLLPVGEAEPKIPMFDDPLAT